MRLRNFRAYADTEITFDPRFNVIIGNNGMGKTAILEALTVAIGSFFLGIMYTTRVFSLTQILYNKKT